MNMTEERSTPALERVAQAAVQSLAARSEFEQAIKDAIAAGETYREIAKAAGLSLGRISQIAAKHWREQERA